MRWIADRPPGSVRCFSCGLLAQLDPQAELHDVGWVARDERGVFWDDGIPHCGVGRLAPAAEFEREFRTSGDQRDAAINTIKKVRNCPDWMPYVVGLNLRDHLSARKVVELESERRAWERIQQKYQDETQRQVNKMFVRLGLLQIAIGIASVVVTVVVAWLFASEVTIIIQ